MPLPNAGWQPVYLGVDIGGKGNTWACGLVGMATGEQPSLTLSFGPARVGLMELVEAAQGGQVVAAAIDSPLTYSLRDESGLRDCDIALQQLLPKPCRRWVMSQHSLMAAPIRGQRLAEAIAPTVGTIIETHPRACLLRALPSLEEAIHQYKQGDASACKQLWQAWTAAFGIQALADPSIHDGSVDALVCATVAWLYHRYPQALLTLPHRAREKRGFGPLVIVAGSIQ